MKQLLQRIRTSRLSDVARHPFRKGKYFFLPRSTRPLDVLAWLPVWLFPLGLIAIGVFNLEIPLDLIPVRMSGNIIFGTLESLVVCLLISRSFLSHSSFGLLLIGCGVLFWGASGFAATVFNQGSTNENVLIHNGCVFFSAVSHLAGLTWTLRPHPPRTQPRLWLLGSHVLVISIVILVTLVARSHWAPVFFREGHGGTAIRQFILISSVGIFALTGFSLRVLNPKSVFAYWYAMALFLFATGLASCIPQRFSFDAYTWICLPAQWLGGLYMLFASIACVRDAKAWKVDLVAVLSEAKQQLDVLFDLAGDGIIVHDVVDENQIGRIVQTNNALCTLLGYSAVELSGRLFSELVAPHGAKKNVSDGNRTRQIVRHEAVLISSGSEMVPVEISTRLFHQHGRRLGISIVRDITERKEQERKLQLSAENLARSNDELVSSNASLQEQARLLDLSSDAIVVCDDRGAIDYWSAGAERLYGWSREESLGKDPHTLLRAVFPKLKAEIEHDLSLTGVWRGELEHTRKNGDAIIVDSRWVLDKNGPQKLRVMEVNTDITQRKQMEAMQTKLNLELTRSNHELTQFSNVAGHDLSEPLRTIASLLTLLKKKFNENFDPEAEEYLRLVVDASRRMRNLIDDLLAYARVEAKSKAFALVECGAVVKDALLNLKVALEESGAEVTVSVLPTIFADRPQLTQLFQNLIGNAIKYRRPDLKPAIRVSAEQKSEVWLFSVTDNGVGFDSKYVEHIFEPFRRLHGREIAGTGIGLATCKKIVELHGGKIWADSVPGLGSRFFFTSPFRASAFELFPAR